MTTEVSQLLEMSRNAVLADGAQKVKGPPQWFYVELQLWPDL
jgi:hypothetical protein